MTHLFKIGFNDTSNCTWWTAMVETAQDHPTASRRRNVLLSQKVVKRSRRTHKTKDQNRGVNE